MRYVFWFWFVPLGFFWGWYGLSYHDIDLGLSFFSRASHDLLFAIYEHVLGLEKAIIVGLLIKACIVDTILIMGSNDRRAGKTASACRAGGVKPVQHTLQD